MKSTALKILIIGSIFVAGVWSLYGTINFGRPVEKWGVFGDEYGALNCLFTGLAFVGLVAAFWHEREQATGRDNEHSSLMRMMKAQLRASYRATHMAAMIAAAEGIRHRLAQIDSTPSRNPFGEKREVLLEQLQQLDEAIHLESVTNRVIDEPEQ